MVDTVKFSQFLVGGNQMPGDIIVGLRDGKNYQFNAGGNSSGSTGTIINQPTAGLTVGMWMRIDSSGTYVPGLANTAENAEVVGVITQIINTTSFFIQQSGYVSSLMSVFSGLVSIGGAYFLSPTVPGAMVTTDVQQNGYVSKPLFIPDSASSGWICDYRGLIIGDEATIVPNCPDTSIVTVIQAGHGLATGNWVRLSASVNYVLAQANNFGSSQEVGLVINVLNTNSFILQTSGYNMGAVTKDDAGLAIVASSVYYLSATVAGAISTTNPTTSGSISRPVYISEQVYGTTGVNAGYILNQRSLGEASFNNGTSDFPMALLFGR